MGPCAVMRYALDGYDTDDDKLIANTIMLNDCTSQQMNDNPDGGAGEIHEIVHAEPTNVTTTV